MPTFSEPARLPCAACGECGWHGITPPPHTCGRYTAPGGRWFIGDPGAFATPTTKGWECPKCGACYAPTVTKCEGCIPRAEVRTATGLSVAWPACAHGVSAGGLSARYCGECHADPKDQS